MEKAKRVLIKIGSGVLTEKDGIKTHVIQGLCRDIAEIMEKGIEVIMVSSGAISSGMKKMGLKNRPTQISQLQALASVGQGILMGIYEREFDKWGIKVGQILVTKEDLGSRSRYLNIINTLSTLISWGVVPIINENDTVAIHEIKFGDNDNLAALFTILSDSQLFINLTTMDGLFDKDPTTNKDAKLIKVVEKVDKGVLSFASGDTSTFGTGGMRSKLVAARKVAMSGVPTVIANGNLPFVVRKVLSGEDIGTLVLPSENPIKKKKHWLAFGSYPKGGLIVDTGAEKALLENGKSLLPSGLLGVDGRFEKGDPVMIRNTKGELLAIGLVNYNSGEIRRLVGKNTKEIEEILGYKGSEEVIHRNNMVISRKVG